MKNETDKVTSILTNDYNVACPLVPLSSLHPGDRARVVRVGGRGETTRRIVDMGLTAGSVVVVERIAPLGDPIEVRIRGYQLSLRRSEAARISVALI